MSGTGRRSGSGWSRSPRPPRRSGRCWCGCWQPPSTPLTGIPCAASPGSRGPPWGCGDPGSSRTHPDRRVLAQPGRGCLGLCRRWRSPPDARRVVGVGHPPRSSLRSTNTIESRIEICRDRAAKVKRWQDGQLVLCRRQRSALSHRARRMQHDLRSTPILRCLEPSITGRGATARPSPIHPSMEASDAALPVHHPCP
jgi:hypothetical protein